MSTSVRYSEAFKRRVADAHIDHVMEKAYFHVLCERVGMDPDDFKKRTL